MPGGRGLPLARRYVYMHAYIHRCVVCPEGVDCLLPGDTVETILLTRGYWRQSALSAKVRKCRARGDQCVGGRMADSVRSRRRALSSNVSSPTMLEADVLCANGSTGPYCVLCLPGYSGGGVGATPTGLTRPVGYPYPYHPPVTLIVLRPLPTQVGASAGSYVKSASAIPSPPSPGQSWGSSLCWPSSSSDASG